MKPAMLLNACGAISIGAAGAAFGAEKTGVIVVDVQGDFTEWKKGSLAVAGTDKAFVDNIYEMTKKLKAKGHPVFATQDWHPADHVSFHTN
ncbi:MAG: isochorismatase family protein, partial [Desulfobacterales bacterium]|nr:isochorismatase family protein [Desulfobacterales bacterium]